MISKVMTSIAVLVLGHLSISPVARADVVLDWNAIAVSTTSTQNPFAQARLLAITQLAVFEAVNAVTGDYQPYLGSVVASAGASAEAAAAKAAHDVLVFYFSMVPATVASLDAALTASLLAIPDGTAETNGVAAGAAAAAGMIAARTGDGSLPLTFYAPGVGNPPGVWETTPACSAAGGAFFNWQNVVPFGIGSVADFLPGPPPALTSQRYAKDYLEVKTVGSLGSTERPPDRAQVAQFYASASPGFVFNSAARQLALAKGRSLSENARALALINMSISDSLVASFYTKYHYKFWRPETAIRAGDLDGNRKTEPDAAFAPFITTPCFPSYPSNHASGSSGGAEMLRRIYGAGGHAITLVHPVTGVTFFYTSFKQITDNVDDARIYGGIHFRFDQEVGTRLGREIATEIYKNNLQRASRGPE